MIMNSMIGIKKIFKVSVIIPSLNVYDYIIKALDSVRNQTLSDIEILCIDGGSTDGTWEIIEQVSNEDDRIIPVKSPLKSYGYQVNTGIRMARGEYIAILESDDYVDKGMYEALYDSAVESDCDYVKCNYSSFIVDAEGIEQHTQYKVGIADEYYRGVFKFIGHPEAVISDWYLWNGIYKKEFLIHDHIFFSETPGAAFQDIGFIYKTEIAAKRVKYLDKSLYRYRTDRDDASTNLNKSLDYIRTEYGLILGSIKGKPDDESMRLLYLRMVKHFVQSSMEYDDKQLSEDKYKGIYIWFKEKLETANDKGWIEHEFIPDELRKSFDKLMISLEEFLSYRRGRREELRQFVDKKKSIVIFGCGYYGKKLYQLLSQMGCNVVAFMDNSPVLQGGILYGIPVISPDKDCKIPADTGYLVANEKHSDEIQKQILKNSSDAKTMVVELEMIM